MTATTPPVEREAIGYQLRMSDGRWSSMLVSKADALEAVNNPRNTIDDMRPVFATAQASAAEKVRLVAANQILRDDVVLMGMARDAAEAESARLREALERIAAGQNVVIQGPGRLAFKPYSPVEWARQALAGGSKQEVVDRERT